MVTFSLVRPIKLMKIHGFGLMVVNLEQGDHQTLLLKILRIGIPVNLIIGGVRKIGHVFGNIIIKTNSGMMEIRDLHHLL